MPEKAARSDVETLTAIGQIIKERELNDPLLNFEPHSKQRAFIDSVLKPESDENWLIAANRCITPWTPVETGIGERLILELLNGEAFDVQSWDDDSRCAKRASSVFLKSIEPAFRFHLDSGQAFEATYKHRVLTSVGWASLGSLLSMQDDRHLRGIDEGCLASCGKDSNLYGRELPLVLDNAPITLRRVGDALRCNQTDDGHSGVREPTLEHIRTCLAPFRHSKLDDPDLLAALCDLWSSREPVSGGQQSFCRNSDASRFPCGLDPREPGLVDEAKPIVACDIPLAGGQRLTGYQEIGLRPIVDFTVEDTHCYVAEGVIHHNSGKSDAGAYCGAALARFGRDSGKIGVYQKGRLIVTDRATSGWVSALDFPTNRDVLQPKYFDNGFVPPGATHPPFIPAHEIAKNGWNKTEQTLRLKNGSIIGFKSAESGRSKYQGAEKDWIHFDEEHPKEIFEEALIRIGAYPLRVFNTVTLLPPEGTAGGVTWVFPEVIDPWKKGELPEVALFGASIYDNPHLPFSEIERLENRYAEGSPQRRIRLNGEWLPGLGGARAYASFIRNVHVQPQPEINLRRELVWMWDFNVEPMVTLIGQKDRNVFRIFRELILDEGSIPDMCELFRSVHSRHGAEVLIYGDARGKDRSHQSKKTSYTMLLNEMRAYGSLRLRVPEQNPPVVSRVNAVNNACKDQQGDVCLEVSPDCEELIADLEQVLHDPKSGGIKKTYNKKDPYYRRTHTSDALGYWIAHEAPVQIARATEPIRRIRSPAYGRRA